VRPHDLDIHRQHNGGQALKARIERVQSAGPQVRVELTAETGEAVVVEMSHAQFRAALVDSGDDVYVSLRDGRVFTEDYAI
jgi:ABC-type sulfate/molybdate transport systems ATPase subunit